ncbi:MAG: hypothetical protein R3E01_25590 [Pirellulaceae bacterium]
MSNWNLTGVSVILVAILLSGCDSTGREARIAVRRRETESELNKFVEIFESEYGSMPNTGNRVAWNNSTLRVLHGLDVGEVVDKAGIQLELTRLDPDEAFVVLLSGVGRPRNDQDVDWISLPQLASPKSRKRSIYAPDRNAIQDLDGDGWFEFRVPGKENAAFSWGSGGLIEYERECQGD